jgi:hypothetical protein
MPQPAKPFQPPHWVEDFLSNDKYYYGFIILITMCFVGLYVYYKHQSFTGGFNEFIKSKDFNSKMLMTCIASLLIAMEIYLKISLFFERNRYKVLHREVHQMIATDGNRTSDPQKLRDYEQLIRDRSDQRRFVDPVMYQKSDMLEKLNIMRLNAPYINDPSRTVDL